MQMATRFTGLTRVERRPPHLKEKSNRLRITRTLWGRVMVSCRMAWRMTKSCTGKRSILLAGFTAPYIT